MGSIYSENERPCIFVPCGHGPLTALQNVIKHLYYCTGGGTSSRLPSFFAAYRTVAQPLTQSSVVWSGDQ